MSNIAGKAYAMTLVTPVKSYRVWMDKLKFWMASKYIFNQLALIFAKKYSLAGLKALSLIHYARWTVVGRNQFPHLGPDQPKEKLKYGYQFFFSNFNGSWNQYVDSFSQAIPSGLDFLWLKNVDWPHSVPETPFNAYVMKNQIWNDHYYNAYPISSSNDVKSAKNVKHELIELSKGLDEISPSEFRNKYNQNLLNLQADLGLMAPTPVVSLANEAILKRKRIEASKGYI